MKTIDQLINEKKNETKVQGEQNTTRFMLVLDNQTRDNLRELAENLGVQQIKFASEIFTIALNQAIAAAKPAKV